MINKVILVGNVGADPEVKTLKNGVKMARLRLATTEKLYNKEKNDYTENTEWHNVTLWRGLADVAGRYIHKGSQLYIEGKLRSRKYTKENVDYFATEIICEEVKMLGKAFMISLTICIIAGNMTFTTCGSFCEIFFTTVVIILITFGTLDIKILNSEDKMLSRTGYNAFAIFGTSVISVSAIEIIL